MVGLRRATLPGLACEDCAGLDPAPRSLDHGLERRRLLFHAPDDCFQGPHGFTVSGILALLFLVSRLAHLAEALLYEEYFGDYDHELANADGELSDCHPFRHVRCRR